MKELAGGLLDFLSQSDPQMVNVFPIGPGQPRFKGNPGLFRCLGTADPLELVQHAVHVRIDTYARHGPPCQILHQESHFWSNAREVLLHFVCRAGNVPTVLLEQDLDRGENVLGLVVVKSHLANPLVQHVGGCGGNRVNVQSVSLQNPHGFPHYLILGLAAEHERHQDLETKNHVATMSLRQGVGTLGIDRGGPVLAQLLHQPIDPLKIRRWIARTNLQDRSSLTTTRRRSSRSRRRRRRRRRRNNSWCGGSLGCLSLGGIFGHDVIIIIIIRLWVDVNDIVVVVASRCHHHQDGFGTSGTLARNRGMNGRRSVGRRGGGCQSGLACQSRYPSTRCYGHDKGRRRTTQYRYKDKLEKRMMRPRGWQRQ